jgi:hypothetical protein
MQIDAKRGTLRSGRRLCFKGKKPGVDAIILLFKAYEDNPRKRCEGRENRPDRIDGDDRGVLFRERMRSGPDIRERDACARRLIRGFERGTVTFGKIFGFAPCAAHINLSCGMDNFFTGKFIRIGYYAFADSDIFFIFNNTPAGFQKTGTRRPMDRRIQRPAAYHELYSRTIYYCVGFYPRNIALKEFYSHTKQYSFLFNISKGFLKNLDFLIFILRFFNLYKVKKVSFFKKVCLKLKKEFDKKFCLCYI